MLIVLDNARDADQVRPLLPGNAACQVVVTSRNDLIGLVTKEAARPLTLDVLTDAEARQLLDHRLGPERTAADPTAVDQIIQSCARLPLALAIVAARAAIRPDFPLAAITLAGDDPETDIRAVFSWSYEQLSPEAQRLFRLLGLHPGPDVSAAAVASLFGGRPPLAELTSSHLLEEHTPGRYTFHDLLRAYAAELAATDPDRHAATHRMFDHYLRTSDTADRQLDPMRDRDYITLEPVREGVVPETPADLAQAMNWFVTEHPVLLALLRLAAEAGLSTHAWQLVSTLDVFLRRNGHLQGRVAVWEHALAAGQSLDDMGVRALAHRLLGGSLRALGRIDDAHRHLRTALRLSKEVGDRSGEAAALLSLATNCERAGRYEEALGYDQRAFELFRESGDQASQAMALNAIGWRNARLGRYDDAVTYCEQALSMCQRHDYRVGEALTWHSLGYAHLNLERFEDAIDCYQRSVELYRQLGHRTYEADKLSDLGDAQHAAGDHDAARTSWERAAAILDELDHPGAEMVRAKLERGAPSD
jgi:tetratricopeptide (TPR) repeat protein